MDALLAEIVREGKAGKSLILFFLNVELEDARIKLSVAITFLNVTKCCFQKSAVKHSIASGHLPAES